MVESSFSPAPGGEAKNDVTRLPRGGRAGADDRPVRPPRLEYSAYVSRRAILDGDRSVVGDAAVIAPRRRA
jgi:hypothetical protein